jgi:predicted DNA-binding protein YlxM (UPF0122 family)
MGWSAVITGDLVRSSKMAPDRYNLILQQLEQTLATLSSNHTDFSIYRGDGFQLYLPNPGQSLTAALLIRLNLISHDADCRLSIGLGNIDSKRSQISMSTGEAFTLSGRGLEALKDVYWSLQLPQSLSVDWQLLLRFADVLLQQMTARQAQVLYGYLTGDNPSHQQLADKMQTSRANITQLLNQAHYTLFQDLLSQFQLFLGEQGKL